MDGNAAGRLPKQRPLSRSSVVQAYRRHRGVYLNKGKVPELQRVLLVTATNWAFRLFFFNWQCFAQLHNFDYATLSLDKKIHSHIMSGSPATGPRSSILMMDGDTQYMRFGTLSYNSLTCAKIHGVNAFLQIGASVIFTDPDNVFLRDPGDIFLETVRGYDLRFQANLAACSSIKHPLPCKPPKEYLDRREGLSTRCKCQIANSGFYYIAGSGPRSDANRHFLSFTADHCEAIVASERYASLKNVNDQVSFNIALYHVYTGGKDGGVQPLPGQWWKGRRYRRARWCMPSRLSERAADNSTMDYCVFPPELFPAGEHKVYSDKVRALHANFRVGHEAKQRLLAQHGMWGCNASRVSLAQQPV
eukprot:TRINITY_DN5731_c0_g1_i1.p1 TRINITY_DN5731_c0_g1~~TRINITY_DN5731_c0_g1_i1.p1  ORF type:complete len:361 (+),score=3.59 TRINITY_DN5731_c0_g1_i1:47-1129(+)